MFDRILSELSREIEFIVVGGYAWEMGVVPAGSLDIDIIVVSEDYKETLEKIPKVLETLGLHAALIDEHPIMSLFEVSAGQKIIELEVVNSGFYSTRKNEFFGYAKQYRSVVKGGVRYAKPGLVWYMRLFLVDWKTYLYKCIRELSMARKSGCGFDFKEQLNNVLEIARAFGTEKKIRSRVKALEKMGRVL